MGVLQDPLLLTLLPRNLKSLQSSPGSDSSDAEEIPDASEG